MLPLVGTAAPKARPSPCSPSYNRTSVGIASRESASSCRSSVRVLARQVAIKSALLGNMHAEVGATLHNMGTVAYLLAEYEMAARLWLQVLRYSLPPHLRRDTCTGIARLGSNAQIRGAYGAWGRPGEIGVLVRCCTAAHGVDRIREETYGADHIDVAKTCANLGNAFYQVGHTLRYLEYPQYLEPPFEHKPSLAAPDSSLVRSWLLCEASDAAPLPMLCRASPHCHPSRLHWCAAWCTGGLVCLPCRLPCRARSWPTSSAPCRRATVPRSTVQNRAVPCLIACSLVRGGYSGVKCCCDSSTSATSRFVKRRARQVVRTHAHTHAHIHPPPHPPARPPTHHTHARGARTDSQLLSGAAGRAAAGVGAVQHQHHVQEARRKEGDDPGSPRQL